MEYYLTVKQMFPDVNLNNTSIEVYPDGTWGITKWELPDQKPTNEEVEAYWNANQQAILDANKRAPSEIDDLKKQMADLSYTLIMAGVI
jgi:hypothetical protein